MKSLIGLSLIAACAATLSACAMDGQQAAAKPSPGGRTCFMPRDVESWREEGTSAVLFSVRRGEVWRARTLMFCDDLDFATRIKLDPRFSSWICTGDDARLTVVSSTSGRRERCQLDRFVKLTPEEVAALPKKP